MKRLRRLGDYFLNFRRQIQAVLESDFFPSSLENDKVILSSLDSLVRGRERDQMRLAALEKAVQMLNQELNKSARDSVPRQVE